jgi:hypothetical protein
MLRYLLSIILIIHGFIHFIGFAKAFNYRNIPMLSVISRPMGILWFIAAILFIAAAIILLTQNSMWWMIALPALVISQIVIVSSWQDANWGTVINGLILIAIIAAYSNWRFEDAYKRDVQQQRIARTDMLNEDQLCTILYLNHYL